MLKLLRRSLAAIVFIAFLCAFQDVGGMALVRLSGWQIIPALLALNGVALLVLFGVTVLLGRVYCSVFCPLGVLQDVIMGVASLCGRRRVAVYAPPMNKTRWAVFAVRAGRHWNRHHRPGRARLRYPDSTRASQYSWARPVRRRTHTPRRFGRYRCQGPVRW